MKESLSVLGYGPGAPGAEDPGTERATAGPTDGAALLWKRMTLCAAPTARPPRIPVPPELRSVLALFETAADGSPTGGPSAPSAGALYPYEHCAVVPGPDGPALYALDVARRACRLLRTGARTARALEDSGLGVPGAEESLVLNVVRPWLSMRKYGDRGYLYAQLDTAHLATHLLCLAEDSHRRAELRTRFAPEPLAELLELDLNCRFVHSALVLRDRSGSPRAGHDWSCTDDRGGVPAGRAAVWPETECRRALTEYRRALPARTPAAAGRRPLFPAMAPLPGAPAFPGGTSLTELAARRRSTKDFAEAPLPGADLDRVLAALRTPLTTDLPDDTGLGATLVVRRVTGRAPGSHPLYGTGPAAAPTAPAPDGDEVVRICMGQEHLRHTAAVVLFHAPGQEIFRPGAAGVDEALLRAGALAQLLCLGAARADVAITTVGGFDAERWRTLAALPERHEVLYVAMLGVPGASAVKLDRLNRAYAHNER